MSVICLHIVCSILPMYISQSAGAEEYTDCTFAEE